MSFSIFFLQLPPVGRTDLLSTERINLLYSVEIKDFSHAPPDVNENVLILLKAGIEICSEVLSCFFGFNHLAARNQDCERQIDVDFET